MTRLAWSDEFAPVNQVDALKWNVSDNSWNQPKGELEAYTPRLTNVSVDDANRLKISAYREAYTPPVGGGNAMQFTSGRIDTLNKFSFTTGRVEALIRTPQDNSFGFWPAFWTRGVVGGWPVGGEIDIMEVIDDVPWVSNAVHTVDAAGAHWSTQKVTNALPEFRSGYHLYTLDRAADRLTFSVDRVVTWELLRTSVPVAGQAALFDAPHYLILNLAVGGWAKTPDASTTFPGDMCVDFVRVYA